jgi:hypothetical protein
MNADREHAQQLELDSLSRKLANAPFEDEPFTEENATPSPKQMSGSSTTSPFR